MFFIRSASEEDLPEVGRLLTETWHATYDAIHGAEKVDEITQAWHSVGALKANLHRPASEFIVADDGRRIAGTAYASVTARNTVTLHQLYVHPALQRQGIGLDLFAEMETCFDGASLMRLEVDPKNAAAVAFYRRIGFVETGDAGRDAAPGSTIETIVMEKSLI
ncbi:GNAT family N-acetyltransferase [Pararhizobium haloflavum]|uniref:GNAT family N-acetyltransferase n=1 Tax=Pararhizobium haloflavum TaxID=2037914 RepID=UPI000C1786E5|nr:GNAT family N-acetyltransferase [Pararhizobium haloflavum]